MRVRDDAGGDLRRLAVPGMDAPVIDPADNEDEIKNHVALARITPTASDHIGKFAVTLEPITASDWGFQVCGPNSRGAG